MKCPQCGRENYDGSKFCTGCGMLLPQPPSRARKFFSALGHAICYYLLFLGVQTLVVSIYEFSLTFSGVLGGMLNGQYSGDLGALYNELVRSMYEQLQQNLHLLMILSAALTILLLCVWFRLRHKKPFEELHVRPVRPSAAALSLLLGAALQVVSAITISLIPIPEHLIDSFNESSELMQGGPIVLELLSVVLVTPLIEELTFRGLIFSRLRRGMAAGVAVALSAAIFGAAHGHIISFVYAGLLGVVLALLMCRNNDSVLTPICCHAGFNGASYLLQLLGDEDSVPLLLALYLLSIALTVVCAYLIFRRDRTKA